MKLQYLKDNELEVSFQNAVRTERKIIHLVLLHIQELSRRRLHLARGYPSLFEYLLKEAKYSHSAAQRRIEAVRLLTAVPKAAESLQSGDLNLSQMGEIQKAVKEAEKIHQTNVSVEIKAKLVELVLNQNHSSTQSICARELNIPVVQTESTKTQKDKSKRVEITFTAEQFKKFEEVRDKLAHKNFQKKRTQSMADVLETLFDEILGVKPEDLLKPSVADGCKKSAGQDPTTFVGENSHLIVAEDSTSSTGEATLPVVTVTAIALSEPRPWNSLTPKRKKIIIEKDKCCQFVDKHTGRRCASTFNLEIDHIQPKWDRGSNRLENLRVMCRSHNQFRYG